MKHAKPKKHHFVPQFILKKFCSGKEKKLYVFDKKKVRIFSASPLDVGHENYFYQDDDLGYHESTESKLSKLEDKCAPIFEQIVEKQSLCDISNYDHELVCLFVAVQLTRTNNTREFLSSMNKEIADLIRDSGYDPDKDVENFKEQSKKDIKNSSINILRSIPADLAKHLLDKEWALLKSPKDEYFYISDHPVTMHTITRGKAEEI